MSRFVLTGTLHPANRDCLEWTSNGLLVYAAHHVIVVHDAFSLKRILTLADLHETAVTKLRVHHPGTGSGETRVASADLSGQIVITRLLDGRKISILQRPAKNVSSASVADLRWWGSTGERLLVALSTSQLVLWQIARSAEESSAVLWNLDLGAAPLSIAASPHHSAHVAVFLAGARLLVWENVVAERQPQHAQTIVNRCIEEVQNPNNLTGSNVSIHYHAAFDDVLFLQCRSTIFALDESTGAVLTRWNVNNSSSNNFDDSSTTAGGWLLPASRRDAVWYLLPALAKCNTKSVTNLMPSFAAAQCVYNILAEGAGGGSSEGGGLRLPVHVRLVAAALCSATETHVALLLSTGRLLIFALEDRQRPYAGYRVHFLEHLLRNDDEDGGEEAAPSLRILEVATSDALARQATCVSARRLGSLNSAGGSDAEIEDWMEPLHLVAVGTATGGVQLIDSITGAIVREWLAAVQHSLAVRAIEWAGPNRIVVAGSSLSTQLATTTSSSFLGGQSSSLQQGSVTRNDVQMLDIRTGSIRRVRADTSSSSAEKAGQTAGSVASPISSALVVPGFTSSSIVQLRVSFYGTYLAIAFSADPLEVWALGSGATAPRLLRRMSRACPLIHDMAWSCKHHAARGANPSSLILRENLVVLDAHARLYHVVVKGLHVRDGKEVNTQWKTGSAPSGGGASAAAAAAIAGTSSGLAMRALAWKDDWLAMADADGRLWVWDLVKKQARSARHPPPTSAISRLVFSSLAGDSTLASLGARALWLWDADALVVLQHVVWPGGSIALSADLVGASPVLLTADQSLLLFGVDQLQTPVPSHPLVSENGRQSARRFVDRTTDEAEEKLDAVEREERRARFLGDWRLERLMAVVAHFGGGGGRELEAKGGKKLFVVWFLVLLYNATW